MGKLAIFTIKFDRPNRCYEAGELVTGWVTVVLTEEKKVKKVKMKLKGRCEVRYTEMQNDEGQMENVRRKSKQKYFEYKLKLFTGDFLPSGESIFPFTFTLPTDIPCSYEGCNSENLEVNIRYYAKCKIDSKKGDNETMAPLTVQQDMDLNTFPDCWEERAVRDDKFICCCCCK